MASRTMFMFPLGSTSVTVVVMVPLNRLLASLEPVPSNVLLLLPPTAS